MLDLVEQILQQMDSSLEPDVRNEASNEIRHQYLSAGRARTELGWSPLFTLEEGLDQDHRLVSRSFSRMSDTTLDELARSQILRIWSPTYHDEAVRRPTAFRPGRELRCRSPAGSSTPKTCSR